VLAPHGAEQANLESHPVWADAADTAADRAVSAERRRVRVVVVAGDAPDAADQLAMVDLWPAGDTAAVEWSLSRAAAAPTVLAALDAARDVIAAAARPETT